MTEVIYLLEAYQVAHKKATVAENRKGVSDRYSAGQEKDKQIFRVKQTKLYKQTRNCVFLQ